MAYSVGAVLVLVTGYDRIALGVHYVSDVVASWGWHSPAWPAPAPPSRSGAENTGDDLPLSNEGVDPEAAPALSE